MRISSEIARAFAAGATILTANARAARWLQREYGLVQRASGRQAWSTPPIEDWETWLRRQWETLALLDGTAPLLLTSLQERSVWTRVQSERAKSLVSPSNMAALAESAYALLSAYQAHEERKHPWGKADAEAFRGWAQEFDKECTQRNWMPGAGLEARVAAGLPQAVRPDEILLVGFDRITPAQNGLLRALAGCGVRVEIAKTDCADPQVEFQRAPSFRDEITACAWQVREVIEQNQIEQNQIEQNQIEQNQIEQNQEERVGVIVPDLHAVRSEIERVFRRELMPESDDIFSSQAMPFEFSLGLPLADAPVICAALLLLRWMHAPLREEEISWLLLSGFWGSGGDEYLALARQDAKLRDFGLLSMSTGVEEFARRAEKLRFPMPAKLKAAHRAAVANRIAEVIRLPGQWTELAQLLLHEAGWPGAAERSTFHFQAVRRWERVLDDIALLDFDGKRMDYGEFLKALEAHARETIFSAESRGAPVQVMGALEASGQQFDALWFLSVDDQSWPPRGRPHPLLPNELQRRFKMPYADAENDLELAKAVTDRVAKSAPAVVFSYAERNKDGELRPSPLLPADAEWRDTSALVEPGDFGAAQLEDVEDATGMLAWAEDRSPGGSEVLKLQAACPFQAFAAKRLRAEPLSRQEWGLSAADRGILLHKTLEKIWLPKDGTLHTLFDLQAATREGRLDEIVRSAIAEVFSRLDPPMDEWIQAYLESEQRRLHKRLTEWMKVEAERSPFEVTGCEANLQDVNVGGLKLGLRADRIDRVANSERLLIDYKTGKVSPHDWEGPRLNEPQLPLYAVFGNVENVRGVLFAKIRAGETGFTGSVADLNKQLLPNAKASAALGQVEYSEAMRDEWEQALLSLAGEFLRGEAAVDPKEGKATCRYCPMPGLCRVAEMRDTVMEELEAEQDDDNE
ncbi:MAG: PD-(D/E)XK nuclease family protein [Acidobacteriaceae bacterium]